MRVQPKQATLNKIDLKNLSLMTDAKARAELNANILADKQAKLNASAERYQEIVDRRNLLEIVAVGKSLDLIAVRGTGTRANGVFTLKQAKAFLKNIGEFKALVEQIERQSSGTDKE